MIKIKILTLGALTLLMIIGGTYVDYQIKSGESYEKFNQNHIITAGVKTGIKIFGLSLLGADFKSSFNQATLNESPFGLSMLTDQIFSFNFFKHLF